jgi:hypothetical protein
VEVLTGYLSYLARVRASKLALKTENPQKLGSILVFTGDKAKLRISSYELAITAQRCVGCLRIRDELGEPEYLVQLFEFLLPHQN